MTSTKERLIPIDALKGFLMVLMAVDHANFFIAKMHPTGEFWGIPLPEYRSLLAFLTRFVTQPCAPGFFFLMGVGMILYADSRRALQWSEARIFRHFMVRGIILVLLQLFLENSAWLMGPANSLHPPGGGKQVWFHFGVLFGLGMTMILGAILMRLPSIVIAGVSLAGIVLTQIFIPDPGKAETLFSPLLRIFFIPGQTGPVQVFYPVLPWLWIVGLGIVFGRWVSKDRKKSYQRALYFGLFFLLLFFAVRIPGGFGNIHPPEESGLMALLNVTKYPPSIAFTLLTLGLCLLFLFLFSRIGKGMKILGKPLLVFGRAALFFYLAHLYILAIFGLLFFSKGSSGLLLMYVFWFIGLAILYPLCLWYGKFKKKKAADSIWRMF
jgi:uncharacterized membrane protein